MNKIMLEKGAKAYNAASAGVSDLANGGDFSLDLWASVDVHQVHSTAKVLSGNTGKHVTDDLSHSRNVGAGTDVTKGQPQQQQQHHRDSQQRRELHHEEKQVYNTQQPQRQRRHGIHSTVQNSRDGAATTAASHFPIGAEKEKSNGRPKPKPAWNTSTKQTSVRKQRTSSCFTGANLSIANKQAGKDERQQHRKFVKDDANDKRRTDTTHVPSMSSQESSSKSLRPAQLQVEIELQGQSQPQVQSRQRRTRPRPRDDDVKENGRTRPMTARDDVGGAEAGERVGGSGEEVERPSSHDVRRMIERVKRNVSTNNQTHAQREDDISGCGSGGGSGGEGAGQRFSRAGSKNANGGRDPKDRLRWRHLDTEQEEYHPLPSAATLGKLPSCLVWEEVGDYVMNEKLNSTSAGASAGEEGRLRWRHQGRVGRGERSFSGSQDDEDGEEDEETLVRQQIALQVEMEKLKQRRLQVQLRRLEQRLRSEARRRQEANRTRVKELLAADVSKLRMDTEEQLAQVRLHKAELKAKIDRMCSTYEHVSAMIHAIEQTFITSKVELQQKATAVLSEQREQEERKIKRKMASLVKEHGFKEWAARLEEEGGVEEEQAVLEQQQLKGKEEEEEEEDVVKREKNERAGKCYRREEEGIGEREEGGKAACGVMEKMKVDREDERGGGARRAGEATKEDKQNSRSKSYVRVDDVVAVVDNDDDDDDGDDSDLSLRDYHLLQQVARRARQKS